MRSLRNTKPLIKKMILVKSLFKMKQRYEIGSAHVIGVIRHIHTEEMPSHFFWIEGKKAYKPYAICFPDGY